MSRRGTWLALESNQRKDRTQILATAQGIITENFSREGARGDTSILIDGTVYFMSVGLHASDFAASVTICVTTLGATVTLSKVGLYDKNGVQRAVSADQGTAWQSNGNKTIAFAAPYTVPADDGYYVAVVSKASVTLPTLLRSNANTGGNAPGIGSGMAAFGIQTGQTDLPATATISTAGSPIALWVAVS